MSRITTHVLDTATGMPAEGVAIDLYRIENGEWVRIATGTTNSDGRVPDLVPQGREITMAIYRMHFDTAAYFKKKEVEGFYPYVDVVFELSAEGHYHVPLLLSPFGYSTYRGS
jgi:5-hydroxyisourate hydrolase